MTYIGTAINRARTVLSLLVVIMLMGLFSWLTIPVESNPDVSVPVFIVTVPHEGISPEDAERLLARPMELELKTLDGVDEINSYSGEGSATIVVEFDFEVDLDEALIDVREAVDKAKVEIPNTAEEPIIQEVSAAEFPVITIALGGENVPERVLYRLARDLKDQLEGLREVVEANVQGAREELLEAVVDPAQLESYGITDEELIQAVARNNRLIAAGAVDTGKGSFSVKVPSVIESAEDVLSIPVKATPGGVVTLEDVTTIRRTFKDHQSFTRANGAPAVAIEVSKKKGVSLVEAVDKVKELVAQESRDYPPNVKVSYIADQAPETVEQISTLQGNISTAMFLVLTVVVAAVGVRSGILVALGIPFAFLFAFIIVNLLGYTYNFMVMFGMLLGLGMLIDGAIVVVELADRKLNEGETPKSAYVYSIRRMFWPVVASTGTTLAAFAPLMFWPGVSGGFMKYLPVTVFAVLTGSLLYALFFAPVLGAVISRQRERATTGSVVLVDQGRFDELTGVMKWYAKVLKFTTRHPFAVVFLAMAVLGSIIVAYANLGKGMQFFTEVDPQFTGINVSAKGNFSTEELRDIVKDVEGRVLDVGYMEGIYTRVGTGGISVMGGGRTEDRIGSMFIHLSDRRTRDLNGFEVEEEYREAISDIPGVRAEISPQEMGPPVGKEIQLQLLGDDLDKFTEATKTIRNHLQSMDGLVGIDDTAPVP
ncbi:MAG: efflux RND transporter permease subunit, partial [Pseudomonadales bacterium]|nr:efflux RND transporter permease subunit [Pseudomonadales bacterium]